MSGHLGYYSRGYLPHCDDKGLIQVVTFRLADSLPVSVLRRLEADAAAAPEGKRTARLNALIDEYLDKGAGACWLRIPAIADLVENALKHFDDERYKLIAWVIMPNHVHVIVQPINGHALSSILKSWKAFTAAQANKLLGRTGAFWQREYFDRFVRDQDHLEKAAAYIHYNPVRAGLVKEMSDWKWSSFKLVHGLEDKKPV